MRDSLLITSADAAAQAPIGGKARNLFRLVAMGMKVPRFVVIPADALLDGREEELLRELEDFFRNSSAEGFAVRSSALDEDGAQRSFAGQFETFLHVPLGSVVEKVRVVRASASAERVAAYRATHGLADEQGIGVIVQEMVDANISGVAFGMDPTTGDHGVKVISALFGLGEGLVSGALDADTWHVGTDGIKERIAHKERSVVRDISGQGTMMAQVDPELSNVPSLDREHLREITKVLDALQQEFGAPQDIEFAIANDEFHLLQARPITTTGIPTGEYTLWDNSNIVESYPGVTTPLTFSFILKMYEAVYVQLVGLMGVKRREVERHREVFAHTLGLVRGRVYYNLLSWYKMLAMVPGYSLNAVFMETMMGVKERFELKEEFQMSKGLARWRMLEMGVRMVWLQLTLAGTRRRFMRQLDRTIERYGSMDFDRMTAAEIRQHYLVFERTLLEKWKPPLVNDFFAMIWFGLLKKLSGKWIGAPNLHNDLLCGSRDIISTQPIHACMAIAALVTVDPAARSAILEQSPKEFWSSLEKGRFSNVHDAMRNYLHRFGERCMGELKLESISYAQDPAQLVTLIRSYVEGGLTKKQENDETGLRLRADAGRKVKEALGRDLWRRWIFGFVLHRARDLVSARENLRYERTRGFGMVRRMFTALGRRLHADGAIEDARDIFHLELREILTDADQGAWRQRIKERMNTFEQYRQQPPPAERFFTYGEDFGDRYIYSSEKLVPVDGDLSGIGCCPGRVQGRVRKVLDPTATRSLDGDILITSSTDPGWVTLFPSASAIIVERGSLLSHSAIVAREMGIPCIVSVTGLLRALDTGDEILMDGGAGTIQILKKYA